MAQSLKNKFMSESKIQVKVSLTQKEINQLKRIAEIKTESNEAVVKASIKYLIQNHY